MERNNNLTMLAKNATIQLGEVPIKNVSHFRPRKGEDGCAAAIIRLRAREGSPYAVMVFDEREDSVNIASAMANILNLERNGADLLDKEAVRKARQEAHDYWPRYLGFNASVLLGYDNNRRPVLVLRDPEDVEIDGLLKTTPLIKDTFSSFTVRPTGGSWRRDVMHFDKETKVNHFLVVTITSKKSPIVVFHREIKDGILTATDYLLADERRIIQRIARVEEEVWIEGEPNSDPIAEEKNSSEGPEAQVSDETDLLEQLGLKNGERKKLAISRLNLVELIEMVKIDNGKTAKQRTGIPIGKLREAAKQYDELVPA